MKSLKELSLDVEGEQFNIWSKLPMVQQNNLHESLSRREVLVSELQFSIVRKEFIYNKELTQLHSTLRQSIFWKYENPPKYIRRQSTILLARLKRTSDTLLNDLERDFYGEDSIVLNLHRLSDLIYRSITQEFHSTILAFCDIMSELRTMINKHRCSGKTDKDIRTKLLHFRVEKILIPLQRLAELKSTLLKICDDLRDQKQLSEAHRALDNVAGVLDRCYECLTSLHGPSYVADIDNILDMNWKPSSLKYRRHRADYLVFPRQHGLLPDEFPRLPKPPLPAKNSISCNEDEDRSYSEVDDLYEMMDIPLDYSFTKNNSSILQKSFEDTPLYQTLSSHHSDQPVHSGGIKKCNDGENLYENMEDKQNYFRTLWCQIEPVVNSGLLDKLNTEERSLMEAKFEIISSEVSYLKSLCILITIFIESQELRKILSNNDYAALFSNITEVKMVSEKFLDDVAYSLSRDIMMSDICSLVRVHALTTFRVYVQYCSRQVEMHNTFEQLVTQRDDLVKLLHQLESSSSCQGYSLISFLTLPLQRVTRLPLLMQAVLKRLTDSSLEYHEASASLEALQQLVTECNEAVSKPNRKYSNGKKRKTGGKVNGKGIISIFKTRSTDVNDNDN